MPLQVNSPGWRVRTASRGAARADRDALPGLPAEFRPDGAQIEEVILDQTQATRGQTAPGRTIDLSCDVGPGQAAILAVRHPSGALTFHLPIQTTSRGARGPSQARFQVTVGSAPATRGLLGKAIKAILIKVGRIVGDKIVSTLLPILVKAFEERSWKKRGLKEGWLRVTKDTLATGALQAFTPVSPERSLLFIHGTFSNAASAYGPLASSNFFERVKDTYGDRIFAFNHFTLSRTPEDNARMLLQALPDQTTTFDVITHSRGGLVLRNLVERREQLGSRAERFELGRAVLVASPNEGTPIATPQRWEDTVGWLANVLELFPDNPFTTAAGFVANGLVWLANHAAGDIPGLKSMDGRGEMIADLQRPPGPPAGAYSALVANYNPTGDVLHRLLDAGLDQFFGSANDLVVPSEGGWRVDRSAAAFIPAPRIGCFGPGGNIPVDTVTHVTFFSRPETVEFLVNALEDRRQPLNPVDPAKRLPDRALVRGAVPAGAGPLPPVAPVPAPTRGAHEAEPLLVSVINGNLIFEPEALLLGHYDATRLTGTEHVMDKLLGGAMADALRAGLYPIDVGSHEIFINNHVDADDRRGFVVPRPAAVIVAGLGSEGSLEPSSLATTVRLAVLAWSRRLSEPGTVGSKPRPFVLSATLIGSGGTGVSSGQAARFVVQGVCEANERLREDEGATWPSCRELRLIELYMDRATEGWHALVEQQIATPNRFTLAPRITSRAGGLSRSSDFNYRGADYDFITVEAKAGEDGRTMLEYTLDTKRARSEVRAQGTQSALVKELVAAASNGQNSDRRIGRTLFRLLIPVDLEGFLLGSDSLQIGLDPETAAIPWELLDARRGQDADTRPWAIRANLLRKLRITTFRDRVVDANREDGVLVIGEPEAPAAYPRLEGARNEALAVSARLSESGALDSGRLVSLISPDPTTPGPDAQEILDTVMESRWRIVHIAGHGAPGVKGDPGGVVLSNGTFLGPDEIRSMRVVPELVFVNCCFLGRGDEKQLLNTRYDRAGFASGVAGALIDIGVRCVVAAGWAVDDDAARTFAETFYASLLRHNRFIDAIGEARAGVYDRYSDGNTWAAYQCYGDPDWTFLPGEAPGRKVRDEFAGLASPSSLRLVLERLLAETRFGGAHPSEQIERLRDLEVRYAEPWGANGAIAEMFGQVYAEAGAMESAISWYERAVNAPDGAASTRAAEQLSNALSRFGWEKVEKASHHLEAMSLGVASTKARARKAAARKAEGDARKKLREAVAEAGHLISESLELLAKLVAITPTMERLSLVGSSHKRRALVNTVAGKAAEARRDVAAMKDAYQRAMAVGKKEAGADLYYPASNCLAADVVLGAGPKPQRLDGKILEIVRDHLNAKSGSNADFWSVVGDIELTQYQAIAARRLHAAQAGLAKSYRSVSARVKSSRMWASVYDNAYLVIRGYADRRRSDPEAKAADALLSQLRSLARPEGEHEPAERRGARKSY